jgi:hypothetical protein
VSTKNLYQVTGISSDTDSVLDAVGDAAGNRFVVGQTVVGGNTDGFVAEVTKRGFLVWRAAINLGSTESASSVGVDSTGNVYVAVNYNNGSIATSAVQKYDSAGNLLWTSNTGIKSVLGDLGIDSTDRVFTAATVNTAAVDNASVLMWPTDGSAASGLQFTSSPGGFTAITFDASNNIYAAGWRTPAGATMAATIGFFPAVFNTGSRFSYDKTNSQDVFTEIAVDPTSGMAFAGGYMTGDPTYGMQPLIGSCNGTAGGFYSYFTGYTDGAIASSVATAPDGGIFLGVTASITAAPMYAEVARYHKDPTQNWILGNWGDGIPDVSETANLSLYDLVAGADNSLIATTVSELVVGSGTKTYAGYNVFSWSAAGDRLDRVVLGSNLQKIPASYDVFAYPRTATVYSGGFFAVFGALANGHAGVLSAQFHAGPNDSYKGVEDTTFTTGVLKGLLGNDGNQFVLSPLTATYVAASASAGISSVTVSPNGSFSATPVADFNGVATFQYNVVQNSTVIATNMATITFKAQNDAPVAVDDSFNVVANSPVQNLDVLANDTDVDGDALKVTAKTNNANATIGISPDQKFITFKPKAGYTGPVTFTYTIKDAKGATSTASVTVSVA